MSAPVPSPRRFAVAIGAAAASATVAIGVTAASLLGWFRPPSGPAIPEPAPETTAPPPTPAASPVILVPVAPTPAQQPDPIDPVQLVMDVGERGRELDHDRDDEEPDDD